jgi:hypothetical protein
MNRRGIITVNRLKMRWEECSADWQDERGAALILVMVMLVMLTFIGLAALSTSSTEMFLSANYRRSHEAFEAAEGAMDYMMVDNRNFIVPASGPGNLVSLPTVTLSATDPSNQGTMSISALTVIYLNTGATAAGAGDSVALGGNQQANYFIVDVTGTGSLGSSSQQELVLSKVVPGGG